MLALLDWGCLGRLGAWDILRCGLKAGNSASLAASQATTKAQCKLFFNLRGMRSGEHALTQAEAKRIDKELNVKPEEVFEMNMRLSGRDIAINGTPDDSESESTSPASYLQADKQMRKVIEN